MEHMTIQRSFHRQSDGRKADLDDPGMARELIQGAVRIMKVDGLSEAIEDLGKAFLLIENAWATVSLDWTSALSARENKMETEGDAESGTSKKMYLR